MFDNKLKKVLDYIQKCRGKYEPIYIKIMDAVNSDTKDVINKPYSKNLKILERYFKFLEDAEREAKKDFKGFFNKMNFNPQYYMEDIEVYEKNNLRNLEQLKKCCKCKCISCDFPCEYNTCHMCESDLYVENCDSSTGILIRAKRDVMLYSNDQNRNVLFDTKCFYFDFNSKKKYIYLEEKGNSSNEQLLIYTKDIKGHEEFGSIETDEELDRVYDNILRLEE